MAAVKGTGMRRIPVLPFFRRPFLTLSWFSTKKAFFTRRAFFSCNDSNLWSLIFHIFYWSTQFSSILPKIPGKTFPGYRHDHGHGDNAKAKASVQLHVLSRAATGLVNEIANNLVTSIALHAGFPRCMLVSHVACWFPTVSHIHSAIRTHEYALYTHLLSSKSWGFGSFTDSIVS